MTALNFRLERISSFDARHYSTIMLSHKQHTKIPMLPLNIIAIFVLLLVPSAIFGAELHTGELIRENDRRFIEISVTGYQESDILEAVKRGIEAKITYTVQIVKESRLDFAYTSVVRTMHVHRSLKFDFWSRAYVISEKGVKNTFHNERAMLDAFFTVRRWEIPFNDLIAGQQYRLRARAELTSVELYFPMNLIFKYIVGYWDFDTGWIRGSSFIAQP